MVFLDDLVVTKPEQGAQLGIRVFREFLAHIAQIYGTDRDEEVLHLIELKHSERLARQR